MGFSQRASCKSQGFLKCTSKKYKRKYIVSPKSKSKSKNMIDETLYIQMVKKI